MKRKKSSSLFHIYFICSSIVLVFWKIHYFKINSISVICIFFLWKPHYLRTPPIFGGKNDFLNFWGKNLSPPLGNKKISSTFEENISPTFGKKKGFPNFRGKRFPQLLGKVPRFPHFLGCNSATSKKWGNLVSPGLGEMFPIILRKAHPKCKGNYLTFLF